MTLLTEFLNDFGIEKKDIETLLAETPPEDFDVKELVKKYDGIKEKLFENKYKNRLIDEDELDKKFDILRGTHAAKINKQFDLGFTRKELESMKFEDVLEKASEKVSATIEESQGKNDPELIGQIKKLQKELADEREEKDALTERFENDRSAIEKEFTSKLNKIQVENLFQKEFDKYTLGVDPVIIPLIKKEVKEKTLERYDVDSDGNLSGKDGTHAQDFNGKGIYSHLSEPVKDLLIEHNALAKVQITDDPKAVLTPSGQYIKEKLSPHAQELQKAILESAR